MVTESLRDMAFYLAVFELNEKRLKPVCPLNPDHSVTTVPSVRCLNPRRPAKTAFTVLDRSESAIWTQSPEILSHRKAALVRKIQAQDPTTLAV